MRRLPKSLVLLSCLLVVACGDSSPLLGAQRRFHGMVVIHVEPAGSQRELRGELTFDHDLDTLSWRTGTGADAVELVHDPKNGLHKRVGGKDAELGLQDMADFTLLTTLTSASLPAGAKLETRASGYTVVLGERRLSIDWTTAK